MGVNVRSWSKNCANCITIKLYRLCKLLMSAWMVVETSRGDGKGAPVTDVNRGWDTPAKRVYLQFQQRLIQQLLTPERGKLSFRLGYVQCASLRWISARLDNKGSQEEELSTSNSKFQSLGSIWNWLRDTQFRQRSRFALMLLISTPP